MPTDAQCDRAAVGIYAVMGRDPIDGLDLVRECEDIRTLETLYAMLTAEGSVKTDKELNRLMAGPTKRRLDQLKAEKP